MKVKAFTFLTTKEMEDTLNTWLETNFTIKIAFIAQSEDEENIRVSIWYTE